MAISSQTTTVSYTGNASTVTAYPVTFRFDDPSWVTVQEIDEDGVVTTLALGSDYTLTGNGSTTTGNVVTGGGAIPATSTLRISRDTAITQNVSLSVNGSIPSAVLEAEFDKLTMAQLDQKRRQAAGDARSLRVPDGETSADLPSAANRKGEIPYFNATTGDVETKTPVEIFALADAEFSADVAAAVAAAASASASEDAAAASETAAEAAATAAAAIIQGPIKVTEYGAVGDAKRLDDGAITSGDATFTSASSSFTDDNIGDYVRVVGAGVAGADHVTTFASRNSANSMELAAPAATTVTGAYAFHGTNDTAAVQAAIDAAHASDYTRTVFFPPGCYLGNWTIPTEIHLEGAGGGLQENFDVPIVANLNDRQRIPTALVPALSTAPVLDLPNIFGNSVRRLMIAGTTDHAGYGIRVGDHAAAASGYTGSSGIFEHVVVVGFEYGISESRSACIYHTACIFADCRICVFLGELSAGVGPGDTVVFDCCITGGSETEYCFWLNSCKGVVINSGDHNLAEHFLRMELSGTCLINNINCESIQGAAIEIEAGRLVIPTANFLSLGGPIVDCLGASVDAEIGQIFVSGTTSGGLWNNLQIAWRTAGTEYPAKLPSGMVIVRYAATTWATFNQAEWTSRVYELPANVKRMPRIEDAFVGRYSSPFGQLGWVLSNISGAAQAGRAIAAGVGGNALGVLETYVSSSTSSHAYRFGLESEVFLGTAQYWEMRWTLWLQSAANAKLRFGMYCIDGTLDLEPQYGVGFHVDRSTPDATVFAEVINNGTVTRINTTMAYTGLGTIKEYCITRNAQGLFFTIRNPLNQGVGTVVPQLKHTQAVPSGDYLAPSMFSGASATDFQQIYHDHFSLELHQA